MSADLAQLIASAQASRSPHEALQLARQAAPGPMRAAALHEIGKLFGRRLMYAEAAAAFAEAATNSPADPAQWLSIGRSLSLGDRPAAAMHALQQAEHLLPTGAPLLPELLATKCRTLLKLRRVEQAEAAALQGLALAPGDPNLREALSAVRFAVGDWRAALELADEVLQRMPEAAALRKTLRDLPAWRGQRVRRLVLHGTQGLGDEVRAVSMLAEAAQRVQHVVLECDPRLHRLFARSFPGVEVRGTRGHAVKPWAQSRRFDAMASAEWLAPIFGRTYAGTPYLTPDPAARRRWRAEFDRLQRPVVGIAWTGGGPQSGEAARTIGLATLAPLIRSTRATFVSLQYRDAAAEIAATGLPVIQYPTATLAPDYDQTAALVAELDAILGPPTSVHHLAVALGKATTVLVPSVPTLDTTVGDCSRWFPTQRYHRQRDGETWAQCVARLDMAAVLANGREAQAVAA